MIQENPKVSVIIPVYNTEKYLRECLDSVVNQTLKDIEIICVDDGSTDSSPEILREYAAKDGRIKVLIQANSGSGPARNKGIRAAQGEYVVFMDADDYYPENTTLSKMYFAAKEHHALICGGSFSSLKTDGTIRTEYASNMYWGYTFHENGEIKYEDYQFDYGYHRFLYFREFLLNNNIFFPPYLRFQDPPFFVKAMITAKSFFAISDITYRYRKCTGTGSIALNTKKVRDSIYGYTDVLNLAKENNLQKLYRLSIDRCRRENREVIHAAENIPDPETQEALRKFDAATDYSYGHEGISYYTLHLRGKKPGKCYEKVEGTPKVSVIMPSLNVVPYICECMESVVNQTLEDIEIICVDAGSTDGTLEVLEEYAARDHRITIIHSDKKSYGYQMNLGIAAAKGKYIGIVETDDYIEADMYRVLSEIADKYQLDVLKADFKRFWGDGTARRFEHRAAAFDQKYYNTVLDPYVDNDVFRCNNVPWSGLYRTSFLKEKQVRLNESPGASYQDNGLWWQTFTQTHRVMFVDQSFYRLRRDNPNSSVKSKGKVYCMCEEYDYIRSFLHRHPELEARYASLLAVYRMHNYNFTLNRIAPEFQLEFLRRYAEDFRKIDDAGELDRSLFTKAQWGRIHEIMECPEYIYYLDYYKDGQAKAEKTRQKRRADQLQDDLDSIHNSASYRIGRRITWLPRKLCGGVQCYRDHGAGYTLRRTLYHMGMWEDEENPDYSKRPLLTRFADCCFEHSAPYTAWRVLVKLHMAKDGEEPALIQRLETESPVKKKPAKAAGPVKKDYAYYSSLPPEKYPEELKLWYKRVMKKELDLDNPKTYNEKIQWMKLYDSTPLKTRLADKYLVRAWVKQKIGGEYLIPLLGVWDSFDGIDFDKLPDQFVLKANHGCGWNIIVKDKSTFDREEARKKFDVWMHTNWAFKNGFELHYMNIPPKIIAEQYMENLDQLIDYKVWCSDGKARFIWVDTDRFTAHKRTLFSLKWEKLPITIGDHYPIDTREIAKPVNLDKMIHFAELMSKDFCQVRVDFYEVEGKLYFGEMTFTSTSGLDRATPRSFEYEMGNMITLPPKKPIPMRLIYQDKRPEG